MLIWIKTSALFCNLRVSGLANSPSPVSLYLIRLNCKYKGAVPSWHYIYVVETAPQCFKEINAQYFFQPDWVETAFERSSSVQRLRCLALKSHSHSTQSSVKQDHLGMNVAPDLNNHLRSIDLFRSTIIKKNRSKVCDSNSIVIG